MARRTKTSVCERSSSNLDIIYDLLGGVGVESFDVTFEGGGDDGQIEEPSYFEPKTSEKKVDALLKKKVKGAMVSDGMRWGPNGSEEIIKEDPTLSELIDAFCYDYLENVQGGWEINEGSRGTFHFDVKKRKMNLSFYARIVEENLIEYEM